MPGSPPPPEARCPLRLARRWTVTGRVQGVGFRPFVYNLARRLRLGGWVRNDLGEVTVHAEGPVETLERFQEALLAEAPPAARPAIASVHDVESEGATGFAILASNAASKPRIHVPPDTATCPDCLREMRDPADRRYRYPFINCTRCGPRYTILLRLPYDRPNTTMAGFPLCPRCRGEYEDPSDRRFHAQPVACPQCGPRVRFVPAPETAPASSRAGGPGEDLEAGVEVRDHPEMDLQETVRAVAGGRVVAVKGIGGYHLVCDATCDEAVWRLRERKRRPHKPLAVMFPDLGVLRRFLAPEAVHEEALLEVSRPIVLVPTRPGSPLSPAVAPGLQEVGAFLPYSPLHVLLLEGLRRPVVATSANLSGEPVLTDGQEVERRLGTVAEAFLHHDRPIRRPADDPVLRVLAGRARPLRLGRGTAPVEGTLPWPVPRPVLAVGGHMKNTVALAWEDRVVVSPHVGDLEAPRSREVFARTVEDLQALYRVRAEEVVTDAHAGYASTRWAAGCGLPVQTVLHHHAHASALAGEHPGETRWIVFAWDAVGAGPRGVLWGGETFVGAPGRWSHAATFRSFRLPGGEKAARQPWRSALGICWEAGRSWPGAPEGAALLRRAWERCRNAPRTTSAGRLFDAAAVLVGIRGEATYEGQAPMELEAAAVEEPPWPVRLRPAGELLVIDWEPWLERLLDPGVPPERRAGAFHATMTQVVVAVARELRRTTGIAAVGLAGGVFQNRRLVDGVTALLVELGFRVRLPVSVPGNDGGLAFGQIVEHAARRLGS